METPEEIRERAAVYAPQGAIYARAVGDNLKFFYCIHSDGSCKETMAQVPVVAGKATAVAKRALSTKDDFIGFVDAHDTTLQFYTKETDSILVDMPVPDEQGSYSARLKRDQALKLIEGLSPPLGRYLPAPRDLRPHELLPRSHRAPPALPASPPALEVPPFPLAASPPALGIMPRRLAASPPALAASPGPLGASPGPLIVAPLPLAASPSPLGASPPALEAPPSPLNGAPREAVGGLPRSRHAIFRV